MDKIYLGIDIGGTAVKMGFLTEKGEFLETMDARWHLTAMKRRFCRR